MSSSSSSASSIVFGCRDLFLHIASFTQFALKFAPVGYTEFNEREEEAYQDETTTIVDGGYKLAHLNRACRQHSGPMCKRLYSMSQRRGPHCIDQGMNSSAWAVYFTEVHYIEGVTTRLLKWVSLGISSMEGPVRCPAMNDLEHLGYSLPNLYTLSIRDRLHVPPWLSENMEWTGEFPVSTP